MGNTNTLHRIKRLLKIAKWYLSRDKKIQDAYLKRIRDLKPLTDQEWRVFEQVGLQRKAAFEN